MMAKTINLIAKHAIKNQFQCECVCVKLFSLSLAETMTATSTATMNDQKCRGTPQGFPSRVMCSSRCWYVCVFFFASSNHSSDVNKTNDMHFIFKHFRFIFQFIYCFFFVGLVFGCCVSF